MRKYRIEQNTTRQDSFDGAKPRDTEWAPNLTAAGEAMRRLAAGGLYYAAIFDHKTGECVDESSSSDSEDDDNG